ncbi:RNA polymerase sigma factor [Paenibacillus tengchongensis]|uniref:RNA polymerase sigma factor n=1 Tax=Paenibacillus tengchongensis TaxID=2608684 RepID=UPI001652A85C|nr:RNA polymerase sigma factor [Paenibacillus tengchongensis]
MEHVKRPGPGLRIEGQHTDGQRIDEQRIDEQRIDEQRVDEQRLRLLAAALNRYCLSLTRSNQDAEDLAQDTWVKALGYEKFAVNPNPEALLLRIARNTWIDLARRRIALRRVMERSGPPVEEQTDRLLTESEMAFQLLLKHLTPLQRTVFLLRDVLGYPAAETARRLHTSEGAVKAALHRARQMLGEVREELAEEGPAAPQTADLRELLSALAKAYESGQVPVMLELLRREQADGVTMAVAAGTVQAFHTSALPSAAYTGAQSVLRMAA